MPEAPKRIVIIGGGISGLAAAYQIQELDTRGVYDITLLEAQERFGGVIETRRRGLGGYRLALCNSGDTAGSREGVVGYGAWVFGETG